MSVTADQLPTRQSLERTIVLLLQGVFAFTCVFYAVMAFDYFISFASGRDGLWLKFFAALVTEDHAFGTGSVHVDQQQAYGNAYRLMLMHTTMGAIGMAIGPFQFIAAIRKRYPATHRTMGKIYLSSITLSMFAGMGYLLSTPINEAFSGGPFWIALFGLDMMVLFTGWLAYSAIRQRAILRHQAWMAFNFGLVCATPVLRILWIVFAWVFPGTDQAGDNMGITIFLLPLCLFGSLLWITSQRRPVARPAPRPAHSR